MKIRNNKRGAAVLLAMLLMIQGCLGYLWPSMESYAYTARSATVNASSLNVRSGPGTSYSIVGKLSQGTAVMVLDETKASDGATWYQIRFSGSNGVETTGYALHSYIKFPVNYSTSADFEANLAAQGFPESYKQGLRQLHAQYPKWVFTAQHTNLDWNTVISNEAVVGRNLVAKSSISSWKSIGSGAYNWDTSSWPGFDGDNWVAASEDILRYYMDPRNFLDDTYIFQFLLQSYDSSAHTAEGLEMMIKGSFLESQATGGGTPNGGGNTGNTGGPGSNIQNETVENTDSGGGVEGPGGGGTGNGTGDQVRLEGPSASISPRGKNRVTTAIGPGMTGGPGAGSPGAGGPGAGGPVVVGPGISSGGDSGSGSAPLSGSSSYVDIIMNAGAQSGVNPYVLAAMIIQEQGKGTSPLISGTYSGYEGHYNFFNIEAYQSGTMDAIQRGLWYAAQSGSYGRPWNTVEKSILGGAQIYGDSYVKAGQNTFYLKKFNVQGSNLYKHQYMTNVQGAASEGAIYANAYTPELRNTALEFRIPVYKNMPELPCGKPTQSGSPNNKLAGLGVDGFALTPTFNKDTASYDLIVNTSVSQVNVHASAIDSTATVSGGGTINLQSGNNEIRISVKAQNGTVREYIIHVVKRDNGPTSDGSINSGTGGGGGSSYGPGVSGGPGVNNENSGGSSQGNTSNQGPGSLGPGSSGPGSTDSGNKGSGTGPGGSDIIIIQ